MVLKEVFTEEQYNERFIIKPPIEVGDHVVDTLGKLAAIAARGYDSDPKAIDELTKETDRTLELLHESNGANGFPQYLTNVASRSMNHVFYTSKF